MQRYSRNMRNILLYSLIFAKALALGSCASDELKEPVRASLVFTIEANQPPQEELSINEVALTITQLDFDSKRKAGEDYPFTIHFDEPLQISSQSTKSALISAFDLPQGEYNQIDIDLEIAAKHGFSTVNEENSIRINGMYKAKNKAAVPFMFVYTEATNFSYQLGNGSTGVLSVDQQVTPELSLSFDPAYWLAELNENRLKSAKTTEIDGTETILISANFNDKIYTDLLRRLEKANRLKVK